VGTGYTDRFVGQLDVDPNNIIDNSFGPAEQICNTVYRQSFKSFVSPHPYISEFIAPVPGLPESWAPTKQQFREAYRAATSAEIKILYSDLACNMNALGGPIQAFCADISERGFALAHIKQFLTMSNPQAITVSLYDVTTNSPTTLTF
jgi:hypothetical protein